MCKTAAILIAGISASGKPGQCPRRDIGYDAYFY
jgi:hypothetical protein